MSDVDPGGSRDAPERAENATGTDVLTPEQYSVGFIGDEGVPAGIFWWNDPVYPANGDAKEFLAAQEALALPEGEREGEPAQLEPA